MIIKRISDLTKKELDKSINMNHLLQFNGKHYKIEYISYEYPIGSTSEKGIYSTCAIYEAWHLPTKMIFHEVFDIQLTTDQMHMGITNIISNAAKYIK